MICKKCAKEIPDNAPFCCWCGRRQTAEVKKTRRRARGTGTIRKDTRYKCPWIAIAPPAIKGTNGRYIGAYPTAKEAQQALESFLNDARPDMYNITLDKLYQLWSSKHFETLTDSGVFGYTSAYANLAPLHRRKMRDLKTTDFQKCIDDIAEKYSRSKLEKVRQLCSQLCKFAMQNDVMDKNYAQFIVLPKEQKREKTIFSPNDRKILWEHADNNRVKLVLVLIYTGFRVGEISALSPKDIHLDEGYIIGGIKTKAGKNRVVPLPPSVPEIAGFVREWLSAPDTAPFGVPAASLRQYWFYPCLAELGLIEPPVFNRKNKKQEYRNPRLTPHSTRHTFASLSAAAGMRPDALQKIIGHADYATTAEIYVHKNIETLIEEMRRLEK